MEKRKIKLESGDIVCFASRGTFFEKVIKFFTFSKIVHVGVVVKLYGKPHLADSLIGRGVSYRPITSIGPKDVILRKMVGAPKPLTSKQMTTLLSRFDGEPYSLLDCFKAFFRSIGFTFLSLEGNGYQCAEFTLAILEEMGYGEIGTFAVPGRLFKHLSNSTSWEVI